MVGRPVPVSVGMVGTASLSGGLGAVAGLSRKFMALHESLSEESGRAEGQPQERVLVPRDNTNASTANKTVRLQEGWSSERSKLPAKVVKGLQVSAADSLFHALALVLASSADEVPRQQLPSPGASCRP